MQREVVLVKNCRHQVRRDVRGSVPPFIKHVRVTIHPQRMMGFISQIDRGWALHFADRQVVGITADKYGVNGHVEKCSYTGGGHHITNRQVVDIASHIEEW